MKKYQNGDENLDLFIESFRSFLMDYTIDAIEKYVDKYFNEMNNKEYYSVKEFGEMFGLSKNAVKGRYRRGTLEVCYDGLTPLIPKAEVDRFKQKLKNQKRILS